MVVDLRRRVQAKGTVWLACKGEPSRLVVSCSCSLSRAKARASLLVFHANGGREGREIAIGHLSKWTGDGGLIAM